MKLGKLNWTLYAGFLLSIFALLSYPLIFVPFPITRDFPWANLLLFALAGVLMVIGLRRAFAKEPPRRRRSKIFAVFLAITSAAILGLFILAVFIMARWLPASQGAPHVGQKAPEFTLSDSNGKSTTLTELLSSPVNGKTPKGVLLIFYRGYW